ncbi:peroxisomal copper amine oxidase [Coprinopsis marcescibilis]|uniref:Amine oxidase n=1 Tax=Coprinopsis marcescibilis TaxID=230819 RepID=A0A5C3L1Y4_COPMA|nr:peroxisomal copper amine oxidase [Coprinopsis marcescibilis]
MAPAESKYPGTASSVETNPTQSRDSKVKSWTHPLDPLTPDEIVAITLKIRHHVASETEVKAVKFIVCSLLPPPKRNVLAYLGIPTSPGGKAEDGATLPIVRMAEADFVDVVNGRSYYVALSLQEGQWTIDQFTLLDKSLHPQISVEELAECELIVQKDARVQELAKQVGIEPHQIFCDGWAIGYDDRFPDSVRIQQALVFARFSTHENLYAHPMDFVPVVDSNLEKVIHIDFPPAYQQTPNGVVSSVSTTFPPALDTDALVGANRERVPPPLKPFDFLPDLMVNSEEGGYKQRTDLKPLHIVQPEGVSFKMDGNILEWQNWKMHIAFSHREGIALSTITYDDHGEVRPIFYRLSLAEMVVPYGAPEHPHPRKFAFDAGEYGMGTMAKELSLGCDCLGQIHYLPGSYVTSNGNAFVIENVICIHEEDAGVLWTHNDYRPGGRSHTVRRRRLVVSMVCTLANYEYIWNYFFYQDGSIEIEIRLTGILLVTPLKDGEPTPYGTIVAPNVNALYHQHMFSFRVDPMIDGLSNTVIESDIVPLPDAPTGSAQNYAGNAFVSLDTVLQRETGRPYDLSKERRWRIVNSARKHYASGRDVGYAIGMKGGIAPMMMREDSWTAKRAAFLKNPVWVCRDVEGERWGSERVWPSGKYVPQSRGEPEDSVGKWVLEEKSVVDEDILVYLTVGTTHIPRPEDWPVMPVEHINLTFKPVSFFKVNPSMDVPVSNDSKSVPAFGSSQSPSDTGSEKYCSNNN